MKIENYKGGDTVIKYGDSGTHYFILSKGTVKVIVYKPGTKPDDPDLANNIMFTK